ncbi:MAG: hypothetical protein PHV60_04550 [bacterium]|nr:hypothetical protein [bacterium]
MEYLVKKTFELSETEKQAIAALHLRVFNKELSLTEFNRKFGLANTGYSYHGLIKEKGIIIGNYAAIPYRYQYFGQPLIFALAVDGMIDEPYRDFHSYNKVAALVYEALKNDGIPFIYCFPNEQAYLYTKRVLKWQDMGELNYFVQILRPSAVKKFLVLFNWFFIGWAWLANKLAGKKDMTGDKQEYNIRKVLDDSFMRFRYDNTYVISNPVPGVSCVYRIYTENGTRVAYVIDIDPLSKTAAGRAVAELSRQEFRNIDLVLYIGKLRQVPINLITIPGGCEPKKIRMIGKILLSEQIDDRVFDLNNWLVNIASFDIR